MAEVVEYRVADGVLEIVMNRPPVNAINLQLAREVIDAYRRAKDDASVRAVILSSALPTVFSAGLDLKLALDFDGAALRGFAHASAAGLGAKDITALPAHPDCAAVELVRFHGMTGAQHPPHHLPGEADRHRRAIGGKLLRQSACCQKQVARRMDGTDQASAQRLTGAEYAAGITPFERLADADKPRQEPA